MAVKRLVLILLGAFVLAGCGGLIAGNPAQLVLGQDDVPAGLKLVASDSYTNDQVAQAFQLPPDQVALTLGRINGYRVRFARLGTNGNGLLRAESIVSLYRGAVPARKALSFELRVNEEARTAMKPLQTPRIGNESRVFTWTDRTDQQHTVRWISVFWRQSNALAAVAAAGLDGTFGLDDVLRLVQRQEVRLTTAR